MAELRLPFLGDLEHAIMECAWSHDGVTVRDVVDALHASRKPAYTTVMTVMNRLVEKGMLSRKPEQQSYRYSASVSKQEFLRRSSRQAISRFVEYFGEAAIAQFLDVLDEVNPKKLSDLRKKYPKTQA